MEDLLNEVISLFSEKYAPADSIADATDFLDTEEIYTTITKLAPGAKIEKENLFEVIRDAGYKFAPEPYKMSFNLKWMLIKQY